MNPIRSTSRIARRCVVASLVMLAAGALLVLVTAYPALSRRGESAHPLSHATQATAATRLPSQEVRAIAELSRPARNDFASASLAELFEILREKRDAATSPADTLAMLTTIAQTRPALALELAQMLGRTEEESAAWVIDVMKGWADREPQTAWLWLQQQAHRLDELANGTLLSVVFESTARHDPALLIQNVEALLYAEPAPGIAPLVAVHVALEALTRIGDTETARKTVEQWARDSLRPEIGAAAYEVVALAIGQAAPEEGGDWLRSLPPSDDRNAAIGTFTAEWAVRDPAAALSWAGALHPDEGRTETFQQTFADWAERDVTLAGEWLIEYLSRHRSGSEGDRLISMLISYSALAQTDPRFALQWVEAIADPLKQQQVEEAVLLRWGRHEVAAATDYIWKSATVAPDRKPALVLTLQTRVLAFDSDD